jgi:prepilin-type N-terminal cleavage/methylation domain-containing protein
VPAVRNVVKRNTDQQTRSIRPFIIRRISRGFSLVELAMVMIVIAVCAAVAVGFFGMNSEARDAAMVQSAQSIAQNTIAQGATRVDVSPVELLNTRAANVQAAIQRALMENNGNNNGVRITLNGRTITLTIAASQRSAVYTVQDTGNLQLTGLSPTFTRYIIRDGNIAKQ